MSDDLLVRLRVIRVALRRAAVASIDAYRATAPEQLSGLDPEDRALIEGAIRDGQADILAALFSPDARRVARRRAGRKVTLIRLAAAALVVILLTLAALAPVFAPLAAVGWAFGRT